MPTQGVLTEADKAVADFRLWPSWDGGFTWSTGMAEDLVWAQQPPGQCAYTPAMIFFFLFFRFLSLTVLVTAVCQADAVVISTTNQNSCGCDFAVCVVSEILKKKDSIFKRSAPHWGKNVDHKMKETVFVRLVYDVYQCSKIYWFNFKKNPLSNVSVCRCFIPYLEFMGF